MFMSRAVRAVTACLLAAAMLVGAATAAFAHDPIFMSDDQTTPDTGPYMPDGSISWALYGAVLEAGDTRGFEFDLREGEELFISLLIPNLSPEVDLADAELPTIELEAPDGTTTLIVPEVREIFDEPFSNTSYVTLAELREPAQAGRYRGVILGNAPSRFSVAIGESEIFFTETERSGDRPSSFAEIVVPLQAWYSTPPGGEPVALEEGAGEMDFEMLEEAMESGVGQAPEGALDDPAEADEAVVEEDGDAMAEDEEVTSESADADGAAEPEVEDSSADVGEATESASSVSIADDSGSGATWVAPAVIGAIAVLGGGAFLARRKN